jgi:hypothetical protein
MRRHFKAGMGLIEESFVRVSGQSAALAMAGPGVNKDSCACSLRNRYRMSSGQGDSMGTPPCNILNADISGSYDMRACVRICASMRMCLHAYL